jgi:hypothetical protein
MFEVIMTPEPRLELARLMMRDSDATAGSGWDAGTSDLPDWDTGEVGTGDAPIFIAQSIISVLSES